MAGEREVDEATQTATTGHEWDGIKELDTPMPRWWLWTFYATIVWGVVYVILYPAWPLVHGATPGVLGYSSRATVQREVDAVRAAQAPLDAELLATPIDQVAQNPELERFAIAGGGAVFRNNCMQCHGAGGQGAIGGFPALVDDDWLWGRHARRHPADRHPRHPLRGRRRHPLQPDARLRRAAGAGADRRSGAVCLDDLGPAA